MPSLKVANYQAQLKQLKDWLSEKALRLAQSRRKAVPSPDNPESPPNLHQLTAVSAQEILIEEILDFMVEIESADDLDDSENWPTPLETGEFGFFEREER